MPLEMRARRERNSAEMIDVPVLRQFDPLVAVKNISRQLQVPLVSRRAVQLDQCQFYFRMSRKNRLLIRPRPEIGQQIAVDKSNSRIKQSPIARPAIIGNRALDQVTEVVKLM